MRNSHTYHTFSTPFHTSHTSPGAGHAAVHLAAPRPGQRAAPKCGHPLPHFPDQQRGPVPFRRADGGRQAAVSDRVFEFSNVALILFFGSEGPDGGRQAAVSRGALKFLCDYLDLIINVGVQTYAERKEGRCSRCGGVRAVRLMVVMVWST